MGCSGLWAERGQGEVVPLQQLRPSRIQASADLAAAELVQVTGGLGVIAAISPRPNKDYESIDGAEIQFADRTHQRYEPRDPW